MGTAYRSVVTRGGAGPGSRVAILGLGGVGIHAVQVARASGAETVGFDVSETALRAARQLGIAAFRSDDEDAISAAPEIADGEGFDLVVDTAGLDATLVMARRLVRPGGRVVGVGYSPTSELRVPTVNFVLDEVMYLGSRYAHRDDLAHAVSMVERGLVNTVIGLVRPLEEVNDVFDELEAGRVAGRAVLDVSGGVG
jgi:propanol-preferring alcohol dehydrogenase